MEDIKGHGEAEFGTVQRNPKRWVAPQKQGSSVPPPFPPKVGEFRRGSSKMSGMFSDSSGF